MVITGLVKNRITPNRRRYLFFHNCRLNEQLSWRAWGPRVCGPRQVWAAANGPGPGPRTVPWQHGLQPWHSTGVRLQATAHSQGCGPRLQATADMGRGGAPDHGRGWDNIHIGFDGRLPPCLATPGMTAAALPRGPGHPGPAAPARHWCQRPGRHPRLGAGRRGPVPTREGGRGKTNTGRPFSRAPNTAAATRGSKKTEQRRQNSASLRHDDTGGLLGTLLDPVRVNLVFREVPV
ncbi:hypothetical protein E2C01_004501 [Portunus trituberculatus]|uniref:Uncharacterized protein n=1 Tax=Portunus trituberculatus TaxID=210409 RepID=A0A5B7CU58_PORTR|nr:hypothetical protein [Portunus trituberculatus]